MKFDTFPLDPFEMLEQLEGALKFTSYGEHPFLFHKGLSWPVLMSEIGTPQVMLPLADVRGKWRREMRSALMVDEQGVHTFWGAPALPYLGSAHTIGSGEQWWIVERLDDAVALLLTIRSLYRQDRVVIVGNSENLSAVAALAPRNALVVARNDQDSKYAAAMSQRQWWAPDEGSGFYDVTIRANGPGQAKGVIRSLV
jgi:hypothetical protein